nr:type III secretion HpaP family protein [uncultured Caldimonas sp.]
MSEHEVRRPRNIIPAQAPAQSQAAAPVLRQAERFQRVLQHGRRSDAPLRPSASTAIAERGEGAASGGTGAASSPSREAATSTPTHRARLAQPVQAAAPAAMDWGLQTSVPEAREARAEGFSLGEPVSNWDVELVRVIVTLCVNTDPAIEAWSVVVPLNEQVLPQTELHLTLSRQALSLRFHTQSPQSLQLLSMHRPSLAAMLQQALRGDRTIDIDLT